MWLAFRDASARFGAIIYLILFIYLKKMHFQKSFKITGFPSKTCFCKFLFTPSFKIFPKTVGRAVWQKHRSVCHHQSRKPRLLGKRAATTPQFVRERRSWLGVSNERPAKELKKLLERLWLQSGHTQRYFCRPNFFFNFVGFTVAENFANFTFLNKNQ